MQKIIPHLWFDDKAEEAARFYVSIFKNSRIDGMSYYGEAVSEVAGQPKGGVMTVTFHLNGQKFIALNGGPMFKFSEAISFVVPCDKQEELAELWEKLSEGGEIQQCGWLKDRFGLSWQVLPAPLERLLETGRPEQLERMMKAMLEMTKIDFRALEEAFEEEG